MSIIEICEEVTHIHEQLEWVGHPQPKPFPYESSLKAPVCEAHDLYSAAICMQEQGHWETVTYEWTTLECDERCPEVGLPSTLALLIVGLMAVSVLHRRLA